MHVHVSPDIKSEWGRHQATDRDTYWVSKPATVHVSRSRGSSSGGDALNGSLTSFIPTVSSALVLWTPSVVLPEVLVWTCVVPGKHQSGLHVKRTMGFSSLTSSIRFLITASKATTTSVVAGGGQVADVTTPERLLRWF